MKSLRKFFLPLALILFLLTVLGIKRVKELDLSFDFNLTSKEKITSPLPAQTQKTFLEETLKQYGLVAQNLDVGNNEAIASISGVQVFFNIREEISSQVVSLQFILSRAKIEGKIPKIVDLRYSKPVVSY